MPPVFLPKHSTLYVLFTQSPLDDLLVKHSDIAHCVVSTSY